MTKYSFTLKQSFVAVTFLIISAGKLSYLSTPPQFNEELVFVSTPPQ